MKSLEYNRINSTREMVGEDPNPLIRDYELRDIFCWRKS